MDLLQEFYETTLEALKDAKNDRLWFKTNTKVTITITFFFFLKSGRVSLISSPKESCLFLLKSFDFNKYVLLQLGKLYLEREEYGKLQKILRQLHQSCQVAFSYFFLIILHNKSIRKNYI